MREEERYFTVDLITCLLLASRGEFRYEDIIERAVTLKKNISFEMRDYGNKIISTDGDIRTAVRGLLDEGVSEGWIEAVTMSYPDCCREDIPLRLQEVLADSPSLKDTLEKILTHIGLPSTHEFSRITPASSSPLPTRDEGRPDG